MIVSTLAALDKIFICIDALDECNDRQKPEFVRSLTKVMDCCKGSARLFVTGRPIANMKSLIERSF